MMEYFPSITLLGIEKREMDQKINIQKRQHFLPAVYLRRFCDVDGNLHIYDLEKEEMRSSKPENVAIKKHIYTVVHNDNKELRIEEFMSEIETQYSEHIRKIENGCFNQLNENDLVDIVWFISFLYARNLSKINRFSEISNNLMSFVGQSLLNYNLKENSQEHLRPFLQIHNNSDYIQKMSMLMMFRFAKSIFDSLTDEGDWFFCVSKPDSDFITTDDPMDNMVMLALSKNVFFMRVTEKINGLSKNEKVLFVPPEWVKDMNHKIASTAKRYLYGSNKELLELYKVSIGKSA